MNDYVVWDTEVVPHCFVLNQLEGVDLDVELRMGVPCGESFPPDAVYTVDQDFPNNIRLADTFYNTKRLVLVSEKLKNFIASSNPVEVEFLRRDITRPQVQACRRVFHRASYTTLSTP